MRRFNAFDIHAACGEGILVSIWDASTCEECPNVCDIDWRLQLSVKPLKHPRVQDPAFCGRRPPSRQVCATSGILPVSVVPLGDAVVQELSLRPVHVQTQKIRHV
jgi:hypothetical protein